MSSPPPHSCPFVQAIDTFLFEACHPIGTGTASPIHLKHFYPNIDCFNPGSQFNSHLPAETQQDRQKLRRALWGDMYFLVCLLTNNTAKLQPPNDTITITPDTRVDTAFVDKIKILIVQTVTLPATSEEPETYETAEEASDYLRIMNTTARVFNLKNWNAKIDEENPKKIRFDQTQPPVLT